MARILITLQTFICKKWFYFCVTKKWEQRDRLPVPALGCAGPSKVGSSNNWMWDALSPQPGTVPRQDAL